MASYPSARPAERIYNFNNGPAVYRDGNMVNIENRRILRDPAGDTAWGLSTFFLVISGLMAVGALILLGVFIPKINTAKDITDRYVDISDNTVNSVRFQCHVVLQKTEFPAIPQPQAPFATQWGTIFFDKAQKIVRFRAENADTSLKTINLRGRWLAASTAGGAPSLYTLYDRSSAAMALTSIDTTVALGEDTTATGYGPIAERTDLYYLEATNDNAPGGVSRAYLTNCQYFA